MANRLKLQTKLESLMGNKNVYYQPPESIKIEYPAIIYSKSKIEQKFANDSRYSSFTKYEIIVVSKKQDEPIIENLMSSFPYCSFDRHYKSDNLNHDVLTLYF